MTDIDPRFLLVLVPPVVIWGVGLSYLLRSHERRTGAQPSRILGRLVYFPHFERKEWSVLAGLVAICIAIGWIGLLAGVHYLAT